MSAPANADLSCENYNWYTPKPYSLASHNVMGGIDLDVASDEVGNRIVEASYYFDENTNSLDKEWCFRNKKNEKRPTKVFLNPPSCAVRWDKEKERWVPTKGGGHSFASIFFSKLLEEYLNGNVEQAIFLGVSNKQLATLDEKMYDYPLCITRANRDTPFQTGGGRIKFLSSNGKPQSSPTQCNFFIYLPIRDEAGNWYTEYTDRFYSEFSQFGKVGVLV